jgi:hypothetical protein
MGDWYRVVKTIKGHSYLYEQQTYREAGRVRTRNRYIGPAGGDTAGVSLPGGQSAVTTPSVVRGGTSFGKAMLDQFGGVEEWGRAAIDQLGMADAKAQKTTKLRTVTTTSIRHGATSLMSDVIISNQPYRFNNAGFRVFADDPVTIIHNEQVAGGISYKVNGRTIILDAIEINNRGKWIGKKAIQQLFIQNPKATRIKGEVGINSKVFWEKLGATFDKKDASKFTIFRAALQPIVTKTLK